MIEAALAAVITVPLGPAAAGAVNGSDTPQQGGDEP